MSRRGITKLPLPPHRYRVDHHQRNAKGELDFETEEAAVREDNLRQTRLRQHAEAGAGLFSAASAFKLADQLQRGIRHWEPPKTPASYFYMREQRIRIAGGLWQLYDKRESSLATVGTVLSDSWEIPAEDLMLFDPRAMLNGFRNDLNTCPVSLRRGYLFAGIHGEFVDDPAIFRIHLHLQMSEDYIDAVDSLRHRSKYISWKVDPSTECGMRKRTRITIAREELQNLPAPITYRLQSFWPVKEHEDEHGEAERSKRQRVPEPYHSLYLLWLNKWRLEELTLLMGLRVTTIGLKTTR